MRDFRYQAVALAVAAGVGLSACAGEPTSTEVSAEEPAETSTSLDSGSADSADADSADAEQSGESAEEASTPVSPEEAAANAETNISQLAPSEDVLDYQVLEVGDGSIATLGETVVGDRPVLLWFFSPH